jgi:hypothetical protein
MSLFKKTPQPVIAPPKTVASITEGLNGTLAELEQHAEHQVAQANFQKSVAQRALAAADEHAAESALATKVAGNIRALLGT